LGAGIGGSCIGVVAMGIVAVVLAALGASFERIDTFAFEIASAAWYLVFYAAANLAPIILGFAWAMLIRRFVHYAPPVGTQLWHMVKSSLCVAITTLFVACVMYVLRFGTTRSIPMMKEEWNWYWATMFEVAPIALIATVVFMGGAYGIARWEIQPETPQSKSR